MNKIFTILLLIIMPTISFAQTIDKTKEEVISALSEYSELLKNSDVESVKEKLKNANFISGDEWDHYAEDSYRKSLIIDENLVFKIDIDEDTGKVYYIWLLYPQNRELDPDVIAMKKSVAYVTNKKLYTDKKLNKQYTKLMNTPKDSKGKANMQRIHGYLFMNHKDLSGNFILTASDD